MGLKGYTRREGRRNGGIVKIAVVEIGAVVSVEADRATGNVSAVELSEGESFALYNFKEDSATLVEKTRVDGPFQLVRRELSFTLERLDDNERESAEELLRKSEGGFLVVAQNGCGIALVLGYSRRWGVRFPMRVEKAEATTGAAPEDTAAERWVFYSEDTDKAPLYCGPFPYPDNG
ncbi:MAG: hypothetical protein LUE10_04600 [Alistipes sp.]|nr:hypothetical protein [Alistipes sp.]